MSGFNLKRWKWVIYDFIKESGQLYDPHGFIYLMLAFDGLMCSCAKG